MPSLWKCCRYCFIVDIKYQNFLCNSNLSCSSVQNINRMWYFSDNSIQYNIYVQYIYIYCVTSFFCKCILTLNLMPAICSRQSATNDWERYGMSKVTLMEHSTGKQVHLYHVLIWKGHPHRTQSHTNKDLERFTAWTHLIFKQLLCGSFWVPGGNIKWRQSDRRDTNNMSAM